MSSSSSLSWFEAPRPFVDFGLQACRLFNTSLDALFYDLPTLVRDLLERGEWIVSPADDDARGGPGRLNLSAVKDPEGSLLVIDAANAPYVQAFHDVGVFLKSQAAAKIRIASITGVGSSALGGAALAWNISQALGAPVLAIVPGYGVADVVTQALGGWFGFGLHDALQTKPLVQDALARIAPKMAAIGRRLSNSAPDPARLPNGAPVFRAGCGSSDVLHALMQRLPIKCVVGHSKGALSIANALGDLKPERTKGLTIVTLGCPVAEVAPGAVYRQFLGVYDGLGQLNAWGHQPDDWIFADHSTNRGLLLSMDAEDLLEPTPCAG